VTIVLHSQTVERAVVVVVGDAEGLEFSETHHAKRAHRGALAVTQDGIMDIVSHTSEVRAATH
jgi:hypothetical protein